MNEEHRKRVIYSHLFAKGTGYLQNYEPQPSWNEDQIMSEVNTLCAELNGMIYSDISESKLFLLLDELTTQLRRRHGASRWPSAKIMQAAMTDALTIRDRARDGADDDAPSSASSWALPSSEIINANRIKRGDAVSETFVWGTGAARILKWGLVTDADLEPYRKGIWEAERSGYDEATANKNLNRRTEAFAAMSEDETPQPNEDAR
jgi:hypothetical protein